jgi:rubredoxin
VRPGNFTIPWAIWAPAVLPQVLTATLSDNCIMMLVAKYSNGPVKLFAGYEYVRYAPPSDPYAPGTAFKDISGDFVCAGCAAINNTNINSTAFNAGDKLFHVFWTGVKLRRGRNTRDVSRNVRCRFFRYRLAV